MKQRTSLTLQERTISQINDLMNYYKNMIPSLNNSIIVEAAVQHFWKFTFYPDDTTK